MLSYIFTKHRTYIHIERESYGFLCFHIHRAKILFLTQQTHNPCCGEDKKICKVCQREYGKDSFSTVQYRTPEPTCLQCAPIDERLRKRWKATKVCAACGEDKPKADFSTSQWNKGIASKCDRCVVASSVQAKQLTRKCSACGQTKCKDQFSNTQWNNNKKQQVYGLLQRCREKQTKGVCADQNFGCAGTARQPSSNLVGNSRCLGGSEVAA